MTVTTTPAVERLMEFDAARGLAMIGVVFVHTCGLQYTGGLIMPYFMALFFLIAGYFSSADPARCKKRILRLCREYCKYNLILFVFSCIAPAQGASAWYHRLLGALYARFSLYAYAGEDQQRYFFLMDNHPLWFVAALAAATLLFALLAGRTDTLLRKSVCAGALLLVSYLFTFCPVLLPWSLDTASIFCLFLLLGYWCRQSQLFARYWQQKWLCLLLAVPAAVVYHKLKSRNSAINISIREYGGPHLYNVILYAVIGVVGTYLCLVFCRFLCLCPIGRVLAVIGRHTLPIMGLHAMLWAKVQALFPAVLASQAGAVAVAVGIICVCVLLDVLIDRLRRQGGRSAPA